MNTDDDGDVCERARTVALLALGAVAMLLGGIALGAALDWLGHR